MDDLHSDHVRPSSLIISSLLNNPNAGQSIGSRPGGKDIPLVHLSPVPAASPQSFSNYISLVGAEHDNYIRAKQYGLRQHLRSNQSKPKPSSSIFSGTERWEARVAGQIPASIAASSRFSLDEPASIASGSPTSEINGFALGGSGDPCQVPSIFAADDFELKNPRIFDLVSENISIVGSLDSQTEVQASASSVSSLQERLSTFLDTVETTLVDEISASGPAFFDALEDLKELQLGADSCISRIELLRDEVARFSTENADVRIGSALESQKLENVRTLQHNVGRLQRLKLTFQRALQRAEEGDAHNSILAMTEFERLSTSAPTLNNLAVVEEMKIHMERTKQSLGQADIASFKNLLTQDLITEVEACDIQTLYETLCSRHLRRGSSGQPKQQVLRSNDLESLRSALHRILDSLIYSDQVQKAYTDYMDAVVKEAKAITKRSLPTSDDEDLQSVGNGRTSSTTAEKSSNLAKSLRLMTGSAFIDMLKEIYLKTCTFVRRVSAQGKLLIDLISASSERFSNDVQSLVYSTHLASSVVEICQARIVKLLGVRLTANLDFTASELRTFYEVNAIFNAECEALTGQFSSNLQAVVTNQLKITYRRFESMHTQSVAAIVEIDSWQPAQVAERVQASIEAILSAALVDSPTWSLSMTAYAATSDELAGSLKTITVNDQKYMIPLCAAALVSSLEQFLNMAQLLPSLRNDCAVSAIELLSLFNVRSRQLILGAGATRSAGLERITAKHLAITSQALAVISNLVPSVDSYFQRHCPGNVSIIGEFDKAAQLYRQHRLEIHQKLVSIMEDRTMQICKQLSEWLAQKPVVVEDPEPSSYMIALVKDTLVLARVLTKFLEGEALTSTIRSVVTLEASYLVREYEKAPQTDDIQRQLKIDRQHYCDKISSIIDIQVQELFDITHKEQSSG